MSFKKIFKKIGFRNWNFSQLFHRLIFFKCVKMSQKTGVFFWVKWVFFKVKPPFFKKNTPILTCFHSRFLPFFKNFCGLKWKFFKLPFKNLSFLGIKKPVFHLKTGKKCNESWNQTAYLKKLLTEFTAGLTAMERSWRVDLV